MKFAVTALVLFSVVATSNAARAEEVNCVVNSFSKKTNVSGVAVLKNIAWGKEFLNLYSLTNGETGSFTIQTEMTSPDSGIEFITIQNQKADTCKEEALFKNNQEGQGIYSGVRTTCYPTEDQILSVSCYWL